MRNKGLAAQLIILILATTTLIFLAAFFYQFFAAKKQVMRTVSENARSLTRETAARIEIIVRGVEKIPLNLKATLERSALKGAADRSTLTSDDLASMIKNALDQNAEIFGVGIAFEPYAFDPNRYYFAPYGFRQGGGLKSTWLGSESYRYFFLDWYQVPKELNRPHWSEPYFDEGAGRIIEATYSLPFYRLVNGVRKVWGVIEADVDLMKLRDIVLAVKFYETGYAFLISQNGVFVTHPQVAWIMRESIFSIAEARGDPRLRQIGRDMIRGGEGIVSLQDFFSGKPSFMYYAPLPGTGWTLAVVFPEDELYAEVHSLSRRTILIGVLGLILLGVMITFISRTIARPLQTLAQATSAIGSGDFSVAVPEKGAKEIVHLAQSFNQLGSQLTEYIAKRDFIRDTFGRYVTQEVVKRILEANGLTLGGETREVSLIMSDLRGFTALTAEMEPQQVVTFLNRYLGKMIEILLDNEAVIDEIIGDGLLAFFGAPNPMADHAARAVACALHMQAAMDGINALNEADGFPHLEMGIAVNTGQVVVGNIGSERRTKYSVVGAHVNFTGRMEASSVGGQVLISASTYERLKDLVVLRGTLRVEMKGVPDPATLYDVCGLGGPYHLHLKDRRVTLVPLKERLPIHLYRLREKIVSGVTGAAWITHLSETGATVVFEGELGQWEDVRLHLLDENLKEKPGKIYGKVISVTTGPAPLKEAAVSFTSVSPQIYRIIRQATEAA
jgi:sigma-B regulation protein RsbU (phosphoserine phosphatase)